MTDLIKDIDKTTYLTVLGDGDGIADAKIVIGGESVTDRFLPNINSSKWDDEVFCNLNYKTMTVSTEKETLVDDKIEIVVGDTKFRSYVLNSGVLEIELDFASRPPGDDIEFDVKHTEGLKWNYQDELTQFEIDHGCVRAENVIGSYALKWKRNNKYKTGNFKHLYSWKLTDANKSESLARLEYVPLTKTTGTLKVKCDKKWLDKAVYPVRAMGNGHTLGLNSKGASETSLGGWSVSSEVTDADGGGDISQINAYLHFNDFGTAYCKVACFTNGTAEPDVPVAGGTTIFTLTDLEDLLFTDNTYTGEITNGGTFHLVGAASSNSLKVWYNSGGTGDYIFGAYADAIPEGATWSDYTYDVSIWVDYAAVDFPTTEVIEAFTGVTDTTPPNSNWTNV